MEKRWKIGIFIPNYKDYLKDAQNFVMKLIKDKNENIIKIKHCFGDYEILTDKSEYLFKTLACCVRGHRWHEVFIFDSDVMDGENIEYIISKIIPYDLNNIEKGYYNKYTHYMNK